MILSLGQSQLAPDKFPRHKTRGQVSGMLSFYMFYFLWDWIIAPAALCLFIPEIRFSGLHSSVTVTSPGGTLRFSYVNPPNEATGLASGDPNYRNTHPPLGRQIGWLNERFPTRSPHQPYVIQSCFYNQSQVQTTSFTDPHKWLDRESLKIQSDSFWARGKW